MPGPTILLALMAGLIVLVMALGFWFWLRRSARHAGAHTEPRSQSSEASAEARAVRPVNTPPPEPSTSVPARSAVAQGQLPVPVLPAEAPAEPKDASQGPVAALMTYIKADGSMRERSLVIFSRNVSGGVFTSLNCRMDGERLVKTFLLQGISRLELPGMTPPLVLSTPAEITAWLERTIPERGSGSASRRQGPSPETGADPAKTTAPAAATSPTSLTQPRPLTSLLPRGARGFAVLDLETTGKGRHCRIVEIALVRLDPQGRIIEEWETLVQPGIPIPNADIHGIDDGLVAAAPRFAQIAGLLAAKLHQHVLVAHNLRTFDGPILEAHFSEVEEVELTIGKGLDTMPRPMLKLAELCARHGVELEPGHAHTALGDTRALARALQSGMSHLTPAEDMVVVHRNGLLHQPCTPITRRLAAHQGAANGWKPIDLTLEAGQLFYTTGPRSMANDTEIKRAEAHATSLGLAYRKVNKISLKSPPVFLLSTSLELTNAKMDAARERKIPVVLCRDLMRARSGDMLRAWVHHQPQ